MKLKKLAVGVGIALSALAGSAFGQAVNGALVNGENIFSDDSFEVLVDNDGSGGISDGDYLIGVAVITSYPSAGILGPVANEFTLVFATEVLGPPVPVPAAVCNPGGTLTSCSVFTFGSGTTTLNDKLNAGGFADVAGGDTADSTVVFLEDAANDFDASTPATGFATAGNGTLRMVVGDSGAGDGWTGTGPTDLTEIGTVAAGAAIGSFGIDQTILFEDLAGGFDPNIVGSGTIRAPGANTTFPIVDDTTITVQRVPEPGTLALAGLALTAVGGLARRRKA